MDTGIELKPKVLFIMGRGRSGSTILDNLLGQLNGYFSLGQINDLWKKLLQGRTCGCGAAIRECEIWTAVLAAAQYDDALGSLDPQQIVGWQEGVVSQRNILRLLRERPGRTTGWEALDAYLRLLGRVYGELARVTGARVLIDSSKAASHGALIRLVPGITPYFVHLVRDPRAVAYSRQRHKVGPDGEMPRFGPAESTRGWLMQNLKGHLVNRRVPADRRLRIRYEDFVAQPLPTLQAITELMGEEPPPAGFVDGRRVRLGKNHTVAGNPSRFRTGAIELRSDDEWLVAQPRVDRLVVTAISWPLLLIYGYPLRPDPGRGRGARDVA